MNYKIEKLIPFWVAGSLNMMGLQTGWSVYPIKYKEKQYVVDVKLDESNIPNEIIKAVCCVYEYGEKSVGVYLENIEEPKFFMQIFLNWKQMKEWWILFT